MTCRSSAKRASLHLQRLTGWSLKSCEELHASYSADAIEQLAKLRGTAIDTASEEYARWRKRARRAVEQAKGELK